MRIKRFEGPNVESVLAQVQREVGPQAVILSTEPKLTGGVVVLTAAQEDEQSISMTTASLEGTRPRGDLRRATMAHSAEREFDDRRITVRPPFQSAMALERHLTRQGLIKKLTQHLVNRHAEGPSAVRSALERMVRVLPDRRGPWRCAFVGPAGSGKTTSLAKMAARRVADGRSVELWTLDTYRVGAIEQMEKYAEILGAQFRALKGREDILEAWRDYDGKSDVFIDTGGVSPYDDRRLMDMRATLKTPLDLEILLVQGAATAPAELVSCIRRYAPLHIAGTILTKIDETARVGVVINLPFISGIPLRFLGTGPEVPEQGFRATATMIAEAMLSEEPSRAFAEISDE